MTVDIKVVGRNSKRDAAGNAKIGKEHWNGYKNVADFEIIVGAVEN